MDLGFASRRPVLPVPVIELSCCLRQAGRVSQVTTPAWLTSGCLLFPLLSAQSRSRVRLFAAPWTVARHAPLSMEFSRQEYWSGFPFLTQAHPPHPGIEPRSLESADRSFTTRATWETSVPFVNSHKLMHTLMGCDSFHIATLSITGARTTGAEAKFSPVA